MSPLRVGVDARPLSHPHTGIGRYTQAILKRVARQNDLELFLYGAAPLSWTPEGAAIRCPAEPAGRWQSTVTAQRRFARWAREDRVDVFWSPRHHLPLRLPCPSAVTIHDLVWRAAPQTMAPFARFVERALMGPSIRRATRVICVSHATRDALIRWRPAAADKTVVIHEAACVSPADVDAPPAQTGTPFFLFVGTFEPRKNLMRLVRAFIEVQNRIPHHLVLAGGAGWGGVTEAIEELLAQHSDHRVRIVRPDSDQELGALYSGCDALALVSVYEGFGLPVVEAMTFRKPSIVARNSSLPEVAGEAALYVDAEDEGQISQALLQLALDPDLRGKLATAAAERASNFSWDMAAQATLTQIRAAAAR